MGGIQVGEARQRRRESTVAGATERGIRPASGGSVRVYKRTHAKAKRAWAGRGRAGRRRHANEVRGKYSDGGAPGAVKASLVLSSAVAFARRFRKLGGSSDRHM